MHNKIMKNITKKIIVLLLSVVIAASVFAVPVSASAIQKGSIYPTIYVPGRDENLLVDDVDAENPVNIRANLDVNVSEFATKLSPKIASALINGNWEDYSNTLESLISPMFSSVVLDKNGNRKDNSGVVFEINNTTVKKIFQTDGTYRIDTYRFLYDYRLDAFENAAILDEYVKCVKEVTGAKKVNLLGRCEGSNIVAAYLEKYGTPEEINSILFVWPSVLGLCSVTSFFTGRISLDMDAVERNLVAEGSEGLSTSIIQILNLTNSLDTAASAFNRIYSEVAPTLMPKLVLDTFGTMPSFWEMVEPSKYQEARSFVFSGRESEYAGLLEKTDYYYEHVGSRIDEILKHYTDNGTFFSCVAKYGYPGSSLCTDYRNTQTDGMASLSASSLGATVAPFGEKLSTDSTDKKIAEGKGDYISPDNTIDSSTCLYPESTWFVKNVKHANMPNALEDFCAILLAYGYQPTIHSSGRYPAFLLYDSRSGSVVPLTAENDIDISDTESSQQSGTKGFFAKITAFFRRIIERLKSLFNK